MVTPEDIRQAASVISGHVIRTPVIFSPTFSTMTGANVYLKLENLQLGGSFKVRGAQNAIHARRNAIGPKGVIAASAGNHAQGVALAARNAGIPATIVMPEWVSVSKEAATRGYGAEVIIHGTTLDESIRHAMSLAAEGFSFIHPFDDPAVIAGQGTIGLEIIGDLPDAATVVVPVGGGGLIAGIATAVRDANPGIRVIGAQSRACPSCAAALEAGHPVTVPAGPSVADGILVNPVGKLPLEVIEKLVEGVVLVDEPAIISAVNLLLARKKVLAEGAGAVALAALLSGGVTVEPGSTVVAVISGGNVDIPLVDRILRRGLLEGRRILHIAVAIDDEAGALARLLGLCAAGRANVLHLRQSRLDRDLSLRMVRVELELETRGSEHNAAIAASLRREGYRVELF
ncbi:MAG: threonine ammonia-lyase [Methanomicrobiales archaeon]|nr:threonine ammonia-lyase [Methanomicrobiales archaeon]